jgi:hypothetical protein
MFSPPLLRRLTYGEGTATPEGNHSQKALPDRWLPTDNAWPYGLAMCYCRYEYPV